MADHPLIDILCLCHNQIRITKGFVENLYANTNNFRISFLDNNSTDGTAEYLKEISKTNNNCFYFYSNTNLGIIKGRNFLAKSLFSSDYFINNPSCYFLNIDNDQYVQKDWLNILYLKILEGYDIVGVDAWKLYPPGSKKNIVSAGQLIKDSSYFPFYHCSSNKDKFTYVGCGGCLIKKHVYDNIGLFDEIYGMCYFEDPDFCFTVIKSGYKIAWEPNCKIIHLAHQTMNNQKSYDKNKEFFDSWKLFKDKWYPYFPLEN